MLVILNFHILASFFGQLFPSYLNLQDELQSPVRVGQIALLLFFSELLETEPSSVVLEVKNFASHSGELNSCILEENPMIYMVVVKIFFYDNHLTLL